MSNTLFAVLYFPVYVLAELNHQVSWAAILNNVQRPKFGESTNLPREWGIAVKRSTTYAIHSTPLSFTSPQFCTLPRFLLATLFKMAAQWAQQIKLRQHIGKQGTVSGLMYHYTISNILHFTLADQSATRLGSTYTKQQSECLQKVSKEILIFNCPLS